MMIQAVLGNPNHPEYGVATIPFPIPNTSTHTAWSCWRHWRSATRSRRTASGEDRQFLHCPETSEMLTVNVEELNYLAKRLESFDTVRPRSFWRWRTS